MKTIPKNAKGLLFIILLIIIGYIVLRSIVRRFFSILSFKESKPCASCSF